MPFLSSSKQVVMHTELLLELKKTAYAGALDVIPMDAFDLKRSPFNLYNWVDINYTVLSEGQNLKPPSRMHFLLAL